MGVFDLFSKRQQRARGEVPDVYVYDALPQTLRVQIVHIIRDAFGVDGYYGRGTVESAYESVNDALCREYGVFELVKNSESNSNSVLNFFLKEGNFERALDVIEICFRFINLHISVDLDYQYETKRKINNIDAIDELNSRFKEHGIGYQFESNELIRVDSEFVHSEVVKPVLAILRGDQFKGANEEFLQAHEHYRHGRHKECLVDCLKSFESTMKAICDSRGWEYKASDTAKNLITICFAQGLLPSYLESQFASVRSQLESGVPTVRNKNGGHGQGTEVIAVPEYLVRYTLNLTATSILFLVEANTANH
ncbi:hypothetical protein HQN60_11125 [Deefgea piscis]|uniref:Abortive infection protein-like C-terminal domain-containing protein n=2 Tax=Deefgea piscis TaxID=2739061 RepID=A0A6M8T0F8_9NEIS|nr:hypothetical protein HQN60_11125 [Deefgea piscis]